MTAGRWLRGFQGHVVPSPRCRYGQETTGRVVAGHLAPSAASAGEPRARRVRRRPPRPGHATMWRVLGHLLLANDALRAYLAGSRVHKAVEYAPRPCVAMN